MQTFSRPVMFSFLIAFRRTRSFTSELKNNFPGEVEVIPRLHTLMGNKQNRHLKQQQQMNHLLLLDL